MQDCSDDRLYGAALAVYCRTTKRFLMLTELEDKPKIFKKSGMLGFPTETKDTEDPTVRGTIKRLLREEIGVEEMEGDVYLRLAPATHFPHGVPVYIAWTIVEREFVTEPNDTDVQHAGWYSIDEIQSFVVQEDMARIETETILSIAQKGLQGASV